MFKGSMVAIATPMNKEGSLDFDSLESLIDFHITNKTCRYNTNYIIL